MSSTTAVRQMHPPAFETIPEVSPVLEYRNGPTTSQLQQELAKLQLQQQRLQQQRQTLRQQQQQPKKKKKKTQHQQVDQSSSHIPRPTPVRPATAPTPASQPSPQQQLPPLKPSLPSTYPMQPDLQTLGSDRHKSCEVMPLVLNRPRKISGTARARDSPTSDSSGSPTSSIASSPSYTLSSAPIYDSPTTFGYRQRRPSTAGSQLPLPKTKRGLGPNELFGTLPSEVLEVVLEWLKELHLNEQSNSCATCWMRDLCSLSQSCRKWAKVARFSLYSDIQLIGPDSASQKKKLKLAQGTRLTLLRRTLRANKGLAATVRSLKVPAPDAANSETAPAKGSSASLIKQYENKIASLIMACPNLEVLAGPLTSYDHDFGRLFHALSTRRKLKTMNWRIEPSPAQQEPFRPESACGMSAKLPADLDASQEMVFLGHHRSWRRLTSLSIHCLPGASLAPDTLLQRTLTCLPSLKHLHLSCLPANAFNDNNLLSLPSLETLTLSHISGISSSGLSAFATRSTSQSLRSLHLRHTPLTSLPALARLLSNLGKLRFLSLVQDFSPLMPSDDDVFTLWMMPYLASPSVTKIHWDITGHVPAGSINEADDILARSIQAGGFPALRTLRTPNDSEGIFQALCRPLENIALSSDRIWASNGRCGSSFSTSQPTRPGHRSNSSIASNSTTTSSSTTTTTSHHHHHHHHHHHQPTSPAKLQKGAPINKSSTSASLPTAFTAPPPRGTDLRTARLAAQSRLDDARLKPRFQVTVHSEKHELVDTYKLAGYVGTVGSSIDYHLWPDSGSSDERSGLVDVPDLVDEDSGGGAADGAVAGGGVCCGSWNRREGVVVDKKEKERWWHTERERWIRPRLE